ncbi:MAG: hypothetical protein IJQ64_06710 [Prevotella sp.]|jgi:hypothetical protein|nr:MULTISPECIES: hypothetical protein [Prevotellaceae]MBQ6055073.1 hypothetical protein [Prevotella sp.]MBQ6917471.1 hypothetical protein [Prevotella sp.]MBR0186981.1 hypothetical protein [Prevotella sp.]QVJ82051.1 hypothetical protein J4031_06790 [Xylanibacter ruminicola]SDQ83803.1 hypothetical protein SAMN04487826_2802 [Prevotella sp. khp1]
MAKNSKWQDEYWLLLMQLYLQKPTGIKPMYSKAMVDLSLELHIAPQQLFNKMCQIANLETPRIEHIWEVYGQNPRKLKRAVNLLREMWGFNNALEFYEGVETIESFEKEFKPIADDTTLTPMMLVLILDEYFRLTPITMVPETPEVQALAKMMRLKPQEVVDVMEAFQHCDPYLNRKDEMKGNLVLACQQVWRRFGNSEPQELASYAEQLKDYFEH